ncbi:MAG: vitamin K epoxide reductase family protein [Leucobacter sp.]
MNSRSAVSPRSRVFAIASIVLGAIGWFASFELATEYISKLKNPDHVMNCDISIIVTCGPNMDSAQGSLLGFSNTILGLAAFVAPIAVGVAILAGARFARWFWWLYQGGLFLGFVFIGWLSYQSIFMLGTLCPWCMVIWTVMIPLWWVSFFRPHAVGDIALGDRAQSLFQSLYSWSWVFIVLCYIFIAAMAQFQLDWIAEFTRP